MATPVGRKTRGRHGGGSTYGATYLGAWSSSQPYAIGDVVDHSGTLYQCTAIHTNQAPPNASYWRVAIVGGGGSYTDENAQDAVGTILVDTATIDFTYTDGTPEITATVKDNSIDGVKLADLATDKVLGRVTVGTGDVEAVPFSDAAQQAAALAAIASTQGGRVGWGWEHDHTGAVVWRSRLACNTIRWSIYPISTSLEATGVTSAAFGTSAFPGGDARGRGQTRTTGTTAGNEAGWRTGNGNEIEPHWGFWIRQRLKVGSTTNCRYWFGLAATLANFPNADTLSGANGAVALRFSSVAGDTNWTLCTWNGSAQTPTDTEIAVTADHEYELDIWTPDGGVTYHYGIRDITAASYATGSTTSTVPSATSAGMVVGKVINTVSSTGRVFTFYGHDGLVGRWL